MKKLFVALFSLAVISVTAYGLTYPNFWLEQLLSLKEAFIYARIFLVLILVSYMFLPATRTSAVRNILQLSGMVALLFGITSLFSPLFFGYFEQYIPMGDVLIFIEGGILSLVLAAELPFHTWSTEKQVGKAYYIKPALLLQSRNSLGHT